jgi:hypothetical protein
MILGVRSRRSARSRPPGGWRRARASAASRSRRASGEGPSAASAPLSSSANPSSSRTAARSPPHAASQAPRSRSASRVCPSARRDQKILTTSGTTAPRRSLGHPEDRLARQARSRLTGAPPWVSPRGSRPPIARPGMEVRKAMPPLTCVPRTDEFAIVGGGGSRVGWGVAFLGATSLGARRCVEEARCGSSCPSVLGISAWAEGRRRADEGARCTW